MRERNSGGLIGQHRSHDPQASHRRRCRRAGSAHRRLGSGCREQWCAGVPSARRTPAHVHRGSRRRLDQQGSAQMAGTPLDRFATPPTYRSWESPRLALRSDAAIRRADRRNESFSPSLIPTPSKRGSVRCTHDSISAWSASEIATLLPRSGLPFGWGFAGGPGVEVVDVDQPRTLRCRLLSAFEPGSWFQLFLMQSVVDALPVAASTFSRLPGTEPWRCWYTHCLSRPIQFSAAFAPGVTALRFRNEIRYPFDGGCEQRRDLLQFGRLRGPPVA